MFKFETSICLAVGHKQVKAFRGDADRKTVNDRFAFV